MEKLVKGQKVQLKPVDELFEVFKRRGFFRNDELRKKFANEIGGRIGVVHNIEDKYAFDYFFFQLEETGDTYSIPYQSVTSPLAKS